MTFYVLKRFYLWTFCQLFVILFCSLAKIKKLCEIVDGLCNSIKVLSIYSYLFVLYFYSVFVFWKSHSNHIEEVGKIFFFILCLYSLFKFIILETVIIEVAVEGNCTGPMPRSSFLHWDRACVPGFGDIIIYPDITHFSWSPRARASCNNDNKNW